MEKCPICEKRLKLTDIECKCKLVFCKNHRDPKSHNCSYDYKKAGQLDISKNNPKIAPVKIAGF